MSFLTYIASDEPIPESKLLWHLSRGGEDIYTEKRYVAEVAPDLEDMCILADFLRTLTFRQGEIEVWRIWQGVEYRPVIRSREVAVKSLDPERLQSFLNIDVFHATATQYDIPVQYRLVLHT